ncbi:MAG: DUF177 domain-containing protein [Chloroflexi bacterium]|nr:DUF177 domain-containing protein [Chloroflexota bacterium]
MIGVNVAQLLRAPAGTRRSYDFREDEPELTRELQLRSPIEGTMRLTRTGNGILAEVHYGVDVEQECGRCLGPAATHIDSDFSEEFLATTNVFTGMPEQVDADPDEPRVSPNHELDLTESIRQDIVVQLPLQPLCREECAGLCTSCGRDLNEGPCGCASVEEPSPIGRLGELLKQQHLHGA